MGSDDMLKECECVCVYTQRNACTYIRTIEDTQK